MTDQTADTDAQGLVELIDQLERLLDESSLSEIEIEAGSTGFVLRKPSAMPAMFAAASGAEAPTPASAVGGPSGGERSAAESGPVNAIVAPLTGLFYSSPSPGAQAYVAVGSTVTVGQVIGLIEAMKLFNEIKSDRAGKVARIYPEDGALVKAKQPLIEIEA